MSEASDNRQNKDQDRGKGAVEQDDSGHFGNTSMQGQIGHRDQDPMLKSADTDFPEPGENAEHTGEAQDPGPRNLDDVA
jgi:hypothetical protein